MELTLPDGLQTISTSRANENTLGASFSTVKASWSSTPC